MKSTALKSFKVLFVAASVLLSSFALANPSIEKEGEKIKATSKFAYSIYPILNSKKIRIAYENKNAGKVAIKIYDKEMQLIHSDFQKDLGYLKRNYDLSEIGDGEYVVKIEAGEYTTVHRVDVGKNKQSPITTYLSPQLTNNKFRIAYQNASSPVYISVSNAGGKTIYSKTMQEQNFSSVFNLTPLKAGTYTVKMSSNGRSYTQSYTIN